MQVHARMMGAVHAENEWEGFATWEQVAWEQRAAAYTASLGALTRGSLPDLLDAARVGAGTRLLDVGTRTRVRGAGRAGAGLMVHVVDQSAAMVGIARGAGVDTSQATVQQLPFDGGHVDAVVASYLLNNLPRPEAAVHELARVLRQGGRVALTGWDRREENLATGLSNPIVTGLGLTEVVPPGPDAQRFADETELRRLLVDWRDVVVARPRWSVRVEPGAWFDALADATPRTGAVLARAGAARRAQARTRYVEVATRDYGAADGLVELPGAAVLVSGAKAPRSEPEPEL